MPTSKRSSKQSSSPEIGVAAALLAATCLCAASPEATTPDGRWRLSDDGAQLVLRDETGSVARRYRAAPLAGGATSAVAAIAHAPPRRSFVVSFETLAEL